MNVAYLVGTYPAVSHTFIAREIAALRAADVEVRTFSVHQASSDQLLTDEDRREAARTDSIQPPHWPELAHAHAAALSRFPLRYLATLVMALRLSPPGARALLWHLFYFAEAVLLAQWLDARRISHVHVHFANAASAIGMLCAHLRADEGLTWSFTMHGPTEFDEVSRFLLAEKVSRASFVACISDYARSQLMKISPPSQWSKLRVVHCGIDPSDWIAAPAGETPARGFEVLCVARLVPEKGVGLLLEAVADLAARGREVRLSVVGDGRERAALEARARELGLADWVTFLGSVGQDRIRTLYRQADAFCLPSFAEGVPVVLMEAMATGRPVVAPRIMGIPELVIDGETGLLVAPGRPEALADALETLHGDPELRRSLGRAAREKVAREYDVRASAASLRSLFEGKP